MTNNPEMVYAHRVMSRGFPSNSEAIQENFILFVFYFKVRATRLFPRVV